MARRIIALHLTSSETGRDTVMAKGTTKAAPKTTRFDAADYLNTEERQVAYIAAALESGDADFVRDALGLVARARGMSKIAKKAGLNRKACTRRWANPAIRSSGLSCASSEPWA